MPHGRVICLPSADNKHEWWMEETAELFIIGFGGGARRRRAELRGHLL